MYHYILQVHREPHKENDWVTKEVFINHPDLIPIADHVETVYDRDSAIRHFGQWFTEHYMGVFSGDSFTLAPDARRHYFDGRYLEFKKNLKALDTVTEPLYIHDHDYVENLLSGLVSSFPTAAAVMSWNPITRRFLLTNLSGQRCPVCPIISVLFWNTTVRRCAR